MAFYPNSTVKKIVKSSVILAVVLMCNPVAAAINAVSVDSERSALIEAKKKAEAARKRAEKLQEQADNSQYEADKLAAKRAAAQAEVEASRAEVDAAKARLAILNSQLQHAQAALNEANNPNLRLNAALLQLAKQPRTMLFTRTSSIKNYARTRAILSAIEPQILRRTAKLRAAIATKRKLLNNRQAALNLLSASRKALAEEEAKLAILASGAQKKAGQFRADAALELDQAILEGERARDIVDRIDNIEKSDIVAAELAKLSGPTLRKEGRQRPAIMPDIYQMPVKGQIFFGFGEISINGYRERGLGLMVDAGSKIKAPAGGKISYAGNYRGYGNIVIIDHGAGWSTLVTGMASLNIRKADVVTKGENIGVSPNETAMIRVELRRNGRNMDVAAMIAQ
ncbi:hypothetical protein LPB140_06345 [Sphingorhabdus lutea]|uniref:M23ase beta-sheet core domain-containing protein n=1 Tax=Sphingorhabdus lutea TaxID=1913578 RepID=A0A1L3JBH6_9SPHN|nr:peptidoglycan DD-metalloendopeptidase family protein [Sphingorhabdus lutea]APG62468.1 hypothetical protein LPB140_06345 [Sphingorhabdus lutea]